MKMTPSVVLIFFALPFQSEALSPNIGNQFPRFPMTSPNSFPASMFPYGIKDLTGYSDFSGVLSQFSEQRKCSIRNPWGCKSYESCTALNMNSRLIHVG